MMKWQLYNKELYSEVYFREDTPRSFAEWETVMQAVSTRECVYWLSPNAFITVGGYDMRLLSSGTRMKRNFPGYHFCVCTASRSLDIFATTENEAFRTLHEMTMYSDFASWFRGISHHDDDTNIKLPTMVLKECLEKARNPLFFSGNDFTSAFAGRVLAQSGHRMSITFYRCAFVPVAEEAFVDAMLSKSDKNCGLTGLCFDTSLPLRSDQSLVRVMMSEYGPTTFLYLSPDAPFSEEVLDCLRNSPRLQSLTVCDKNFASNDAYANFVRSLNSTVLRSLTIQDYDIRHVAFPVEIFEKLALKHFSMYDVCFHEAGWRNLLQVIPKCRTLISLEFKYILWWGSEDEELAGVEFALEWAQCLKHNPNILSTNSQSYFSDDHNDGNDDILYTTYLAPILEHNRLLQNLKILKERENYEVRGFLVSEAIGTKLAGKVSGCYTMLKANVDVLVSFLSSRNGAQEV